MHSKRALQGRGTRRVIVGRGGRASFDVWLEVSTRLLKLVARSKARAVVPAAVAAFCEYLVSRSITAGVIDGNRWPTKVVVGQQRFR